MIIILDAKLKKKILFYSKDQLKFEFTTLEEMNKYL